MLDPMRDMVPPPPPPATGPLRWRVTPALPWTKLAGAAALALLGLALGDDPVRLALAGCAALALGVWAARDLITPVRVAADTAGVTMLHGYAGTRHVPWERVERVRVDTRPRLGLRTETLEIDTGDALHLFSAYDLGAPPADVAERLDALRHAPERATGGQPDPRP